MFKMTFSIGHVYAKHETTGQSNLIRASNSGIKAFLFLIEFFMLFWP